MNTEKAYLLGLMIGGGIVKSGRVQIVLPYKKWGVIVENPTRGGSIAEDILSQAKPLWKLHYDIDISYRVGNDEWKITFDRLSTALETDLVELGLIGEGELRQSADISKIVSSLSNDSFARSFIAGIVDTVGSMSASHRRFNANFQTVSLEFKGRNFALVVAIAKLLVRIGCVPDQVLWNHPNMHSPQSRYYRSWKKGFKIRVGIDDYMLNGSFVFQAKRDSAVENRTLQSGKSTAVDKVSKIEGRVALHVDQDCDWLPAELRGYHFIHYTHLAEFLGLSLPSSDITKIDFAKYVSPFTVLTKDTASNIDSICRTEDYLSRSDFKEINWSLEDLLSVRRSNTREFLFGITQEDGFPINHVLHALAFVYAKEAGFPMMGNRVPGSYMNLLEENVGRFFGAKIELPDRGTCLRVSLGDSAALVGYVNDDFIRSVTKVDGIKVLVKTPLFEECVVLK